MGTISIEQQGRRSAERGVHAAIVLPRGFVAKTGLDQVPLGDAAQTSHLSANSESQ